jgi:hypothetical protein
MTKWSFSFCVVFQQLHCFVFEDFINVTVAVCYPDLPSWNRISSNTPLSNAYWTNKIVKYNLLQKKWEKEITLPDAGVHNKYPYQSGKFTDIDFAIDEKGLWVILATTSYFRRYLC